MGVEFLPREYGYVVLALVVYCFLNRWMGFQLGKARKKYEAAPESENKDAELYLHVLKEHLNSMEMMPMFFLLMALGGLGHPCVCTALGFLYIVTRYFDFTGYSKGDLLKRLSIGICGFLAFTGLLICNISFGINLLRR